MRVLRCAASRTAGRKPSTCANVSVRQHTSAYVSVRQLTRCAASRTAGWKPSTCAYSSIRQHTSAYVSSIRTAARAEYPPGDVIRQHTSAYVSIRQLYPPADAPNCLRNELSSQHTSAYVSIRQHTHRRARATLARGCLKLPAKRVFAYVSIHQHASAYGNIRQHTSAYVLKLPAKQVFGLLGCLHSGPKRAFGAARQARSHEGHLRVGIRQHTSTFVSIPAR